METKTETVGKLSSLPGSPALPYWTKHSSVQTAGWGWRRGPSSRDQGSSWMQTQLSSQEGLPGLLAAPISTASGCILVSEIPMGRKVGFSPDGRPPALKVTAGLWFLAPKPVFPVCVGWKPDLSKCVFVLFRGRWHIAMCAFWPGLLVGCEGRQLLSFACEGFFSLFCWAGGWCSWVESSLVHRQMVLELWA